MNFSKYNSLPLLFFLVLSILTNTVMAADIRPYTSESGSTRFVVIEGIIEPGDFEKFKRLVKDQQGEIIAVFLFTPGGDFTEAIKIGRAMRALQLASYVPRLDLNGEATCKDPLSAYRSDVYPTPKDPRNCTCASACFFIHIGAIYRSGTYIAVHHPYFEKGKFGNLPQGDAKLAFDQLQQISRSYMNEMEVPKYIQDIVFSTPSDQSILLDENTVKTYFLGDIPYLHEWLQNKCSKLSPAERGRYNRYSSQTQKTKEGWDDYSVLIHKIWDENDCIATIRKKNRLAAYEKYFGTKLTDYGRHNFSRWSQAPSYLNRRFSEILSAEKFKEVKSENSRALKRTAKGTEPLMYLIDLPSNPRLVNNIYIISHPNPSKEFAQHLVTVLEEAWGISSTSNDSSRRLWDMGTYTAELDTKVELGEIPNQEPGPRIALYIDKQ